MHLAAWRWPTIPPCRCNDISRLTYSIPLLSVSEGQQWIWPRFSRTWQEYQPDSHYFCSPWTSQSNYLLGVNVYVSPTWVRRQRSPISYLNDLFVSRIDEVEVDIIKSDANIAGMEIANMNLLQDKEICQAIQTGSPLNRGVRYSLTCRDVEHVFEINSKLRRWQLQNALYMLRAFKEEF